MKINKHYTIILIGIVALLFSSCSTVKSAFDAERKNSSEEFLVEKKAPLSMPPEFGELPVPQSNIEEKEDQDQNKDIESLIFKDDMGQNNKDELNKSDDDFLKLLLDKINNK
tara:strand:+ start:341 stop:676 length:336 start_codon:yes stop_codon:yes gene_type:complete